MKYFLHCLVLLVLLIPAFFAIYVNLPMQYHHGKVVQYKFLVQRGQGLLSLSRQLASMDCVKSAVFAYIYGRVFALFSKGVQSGTYLVDSSMSTVEIMNVFFLGNNVPEYVSLTVPEGLNLYSLADLFVQYSLVNSQEDFLQLTSDKSLLQKYRIPGNSLEGYLYPTTYYIDPQNSAKDVLVRMLHTFSVKFPEDYFQNAPLALNRHQIVTLASLIEKETAVDDERPLVSSVFVNRLQRNMRMACDPTVIYALLLEKRYQGSLSRRRGDLDVLSPYNTYIYKGLPPSPIANPGRASLDAAMNPQQSDYLFFVAQDAKHHAFASSFAEHKQNVQAYKEWLAKENAR